LDHPLVLKYIDAFRNDDEEGFLITELSDLGDLYQLLKVRDKVPRI